MGKKKTSKVQRSEDPEEIASVESDESPAVHKNMTKKERKKKKDADMEDITKELEGMAIEETSGQPNSSTQKPDIKVNGATKKGSKKQVAKSGEELSSEEDEEEEEKVVVKSKFSGFAAVGDDDMMVDLGDEDGEDDEDEADSSEADEQAPTPPPAPKQTKAKQKGKKDKKMAADNDWDDLDSLVTPPAQDTVTSKKDKNKKENKKSKKGKRADDDDEEDFDKLLAEARLADGVGKSLEDNPEVKVEAPEDSKSKKRRKRKGKGGDAADEDEGDASVVATAPDAAVSAPATAPSVPATAPSVPATVPSAPATAPSAPASEEQAAAVVETRSQDEADGSGGVSVASPSGGSTPALAEDGGKTKRQKKKEAEEERKRKKKEEEELKQKKKDEEEEKKRAKKGLPNKKVLAAMKELQQKKKEEEEQRRKEEEELNRLEEERIQKEEEQKKLDEERKERKKQKEKDRKERLKAEGRLLTAKQKADQRRAQEMLEHLKAQGVSIPEIGADKKTPRLGSKAYAKKKTAQGGKQDDGNLEEEQPQQPAALERTNSGDKTPPAVEEPPVKEEIKDSWDLSSDDEAEEEEEDVKEGPQTASSARSKAGQQKVEDNSPEESSDDAATGEDNSDESDDEPLTAREKVIARLKKRQETNENNRDIEKLRAPVVCVLGHVDHGKTKILDKLRRTNVQEGEVGGITQQIGATNVPAEAIFAQTKMVQSFDATTLKFPGLLIIDTPGHESFSNLRNRGSSLCDLAILVVDITQGLEPQTIESIDLLKKRKTPFVVALNKVDRVFEWESNQHKDIRDIIKKQKETAKLDFERRTKDIIMKLNEQGLNAALFHENPDPRSYVSLVPTSAITGDGMGNLIALICDMCQNKLAPQLRYSEELQCIVLEVKTITGYGTTIDVILVNGRLREQDTIVLAGTDGPIVTALRSLLMPKPMKEIRVKGAYDEFKEVKAAQGVKLAAKELEKAIAGLSLRVARNDDEIEVLKELVERDFKQAMRSIKVKEKGVYVQASTLGALEALLEFFKTKSIPYSGIRVGPVVKRDVMKAAAMLEHDDKYAVILAFDVKVERDAQELADREGVKIFSEETIYHLGDRYVEYLEEFKRKQQEENRSVAIFPCKLKIIPTNIFNKRDPIVIGVTVDSGVLRTGTLLCVPGKEFVEIGVVASMEFDHKAVDIAKKGVDVCIKIDPAQGSTPKLYGRHFEAPDEIVSKISRESINACKEYFRDDLSKADWKLMAELKKLFNIL